ncbi:MAG: hypothetical protein NVV83_14620 [Afipia sp.]|nr:hypothetical protein [Afipia sp.]
MSETVAIDSDKIASEAVSVLGKNGQQIAPFSSRDPAFGLDDAYRVTPIVRRLREAHGEKGAGPQDRLHQPHHLETVRRLRPDLGLCL